MHIAWMGEQTGRPPQQVLSRGFLVCLQHAGHVREIGMGLVHGLALGGDVAVMKAVPIDTDLRKELEEDFRPPLGIGECCSAVIPGHLRRAGAEGIRQVVPHRVPEARCKAQVVPHGQALDLGIRVVPLEAQRRFARWPLEGDHGHITEPAAHPANSVHPCPEAATTALMNRTPRAPSETSG